MNECKKNRNDKLLELKDDKIRIVRYEEETPEAIWEDVLFNQAYDLEDFKVLCKVFRKKAFSGTKGWFARRLASFIYGLFYQQRGHFIDESDWLAQHSDKKLSPAQMAFVQRAYTWAHIGCSTICVWDAEKGENVCMRSLDWQGAPALGEATRIFQFKSDSGLDSGQFTTVGIVGMLGVLTGVKKGFSVAINYASWYEGSMDKDTDPTFKLRKLMQNPAIDTFEKALGAIESWEVSSPVFITLCGKQKEQACVIEIGKSDKKHTRFTKNGVLVQTNHFDPNGDFGYVEERMPKKKRQRDVPVDKKGKPLPDADWYCGKLIPSSAKRRDILESKFSNFSGTSAELEATLIEAYEEPPIWNWETAYTTIMRPGTGTLRVFARQSPNK